MFGNIRLILCIFILCTGTFFVFSVLKTNIFKNIIKGVRSWHWNSYTERKRAVLAKQEQFGVIKETGIMGRIDKLIEESGLREYYSYMSGELFLIFSIVISLFLGFIVYFCCRSLLISFLIFAGIIVICFSILYFLAGSRYKRTERQILMFINLMENYSRTTDDLIEIIGRTQNYLEEPIKSAIAKFHWEAEHTGEIGTALGHLLVQLPNRKLQEIIYNIDSCRKHEANYEEVLKDMRIMVQEYLKSKDERRGIQQAAKGNVIIMLIVGIFIVKMVDKFIDGGIIKLLSASIAGNFIIVYMLCLVLFGIWQFIKIDRY